MKINLLIIFFTCITVLSFAQNRNQKNKAVFLEDISWTTAQEILNENSLLVLPLGAGSKEHGPHLPLSTDFLQAQALADLVALERNVVITPIINYGFYPAFLKYPGSTSTTFATATDMVVQVIRSLSAYGPKKFYIINIGVSTTPPLLAAAKILAEDGILMTFSRYDKPAFEKAEAVFRTKSYSGHADEIETSNILNIRPDLVEMKRAVNDSSMKAKAGSMTPRPIEGGNLNTSGINGYAALGTLEKGQKNMTSFAIELIKEIDMLKDIEPIKEKDRSVEFKDYEGIYTNEKGDLKLEISQKDNILHYILNDRDLRNFFHLYKDGTDYFSSMYINILFLRDKNGKVEKVWCRNRGEYVWLEKK
jgi:creatinine amidohydrolase